MKVVCVQLHFTRLKILCAELYWAWALTKIRWESVKNWFMHLWLSGFDSNFFLASDSGTPSHSENTRQRSNRKLKDSYLTFSPEFPVSSESWACELQSFLPCPSHRWDYGFWSNSFQIGLKHWVKTLFCVLVSSTNPTSNISENRFKMEVGALATLLLLNIQCIIYDI